MNKKTYALSALLILVVSLAATMAIFSTACEPDAQTLENNSTNEPTVENPDHTKTTRDTPPTQRDRFRPPADEQPDQSKPDAKATNWTYPDQPITGKATWYKADGSGNCSFPKLTGPPMVVAMNETQYGKAFYCGACLRVEGPNNKSVIVKVVDRCPGCPVNGIDLSREAFAKLADNKVGVLQVKWQAIPCADTQPMQYFYKEGSNQWWTAIQVRRHRIPISSLEVQKKGQWVKLARQRYNFFVDGKGFGTKSVRIRITALNGERREETIPAVASAKLINGTQQF